MDSKTALVYELQSLLQELSPDDLQKAIDVIDALLAIAKQREQDNKKDADTLSI